MVLETFVAYAFNSYIADYFDNINVDQLKIAFEKGEVELERLPLKKDALKQFNLPVDVLEGIVGKISIKVPILALLTEPWIVKIKDLTLTVAPVINDADETMQSEQGSLDSIEWTTPEWRTYYDKRYDQSYYASSYTSWLSSVKSVVGDIYKNIQLEVETLNIHYEDLNLGGFKLDIGKLSFQQPDRLSKLVLNDISITFVNNCLEDLARVEMDHLTLEFSTDEETHDTLVKGTTSCLNITDLNIDGKFPTNVSRNLETEIIDFKFTKYNRINQIDTNKAVEKDLVLEADVSSMQYVHSNRFYKETICYIKNIVKSLLHSQDEFDNNLKRQQSKWCEEFNKLIDINIQNGTIYVITDDKDYYLPMLQIPIQDFNIWQCSNNDQRNGLISSKVKCNYYNRELSGWEPFLEPWKFQLIYDLNTDSTKENRCNRKLGLTLKSDELIKLNLTSSFLDLYHIALRNEIIELKSTFFGHRVWNLRSLTLPTFEESMNGIKNSNKKNNHSLFVLRNETGCRMHFRLDVSSKEIYSAQKKSSDRKISNNDSTSSHISLSGSESPQECSKSQECSARDSSASLYTGLFSKSNQTNKPRWITVDINESVPFDFDENPIARLKSSGIGQNEGHEIVVRIEGWKNMQPVSVDTVGIFFREASSDQITKEDAIIVFSILLDGNSARKIITVRSALQLSNKLDTNMEVHFVESNQTLYIMPDYCLPVPMNYLYDTMCIRPCSVGVTMSEKPLDWEQLRTRNEASSEIHICHPITVTTHKQSSYCTSLPYRVAVLIQREDLPDESLDWIVSSRTKPAHCITFLPPLTVVNLLPCRINYFIHPTNSNDSLEPGKEVKIHHVDTTQIFNIYFMMDNFPKSKPLSFSPGATRDFTHILEMIDERNRTLFLQAKVILSLGESPSLQVLISAPYWFVNRTGLPIIFKQEGGVLEAAGQFDEHEESRIKTPLLFSFYDSDCPMMCSMRLGKSQGQSKWCRSFYIESGGGVRRLRTIEDDENGHCIYEIAIEIRKGTGRYQDTHIVTFSSRHGFDSVARTPIAIKPSPQRRQLISYNPNANLAERIANHAMNMFACKQHFQTGFSFRVPGLTVSVINKSNEELIFASFEDVMMEYSSNVKEHLLNCSIQNVNIYNQLFDAEKRLAVSFDHGNSDGDNEIVKPAVRLLIDRLVSHSFSANVFKQVQLSLGNLVLNIEEKLILRLIEFVGYKDPTNELNLLEDQEGMQRLAKRKQPNYYLGLLRIDLSQLCLSVLTASSLPAELERIKEYLGFKFIQFEDAHVEFTPYMKMNVFETIHTALESIGRYYKAELKRQAARILGAVLGRLLNIRANWIGRR